MVGNFPVDVFDLLDHGTGQPGYGTMAKVDRGRCIRANCKAAVVNDSGFCGPCLAWALGEGDDEPEPPAAGPPTPEPYPPGDEDEWNAYLSRARRMTS